MLAALAAGRREDTNRSNASCHQWKCTQSKWNEKSSLAKSKHDLPRYRSLSLLLFRFKV